MCTFALQVQVFQLSKCTCTWEHASGRTRVKLQIVWLLMTRQTHDWANIFYQDFKIIFRLNNELNNQCKMGADMSSPIDEQKQEQIQKIVSDFVATFGKIFPGISKELYIFSMHLFICNYIAIGSYKAALIESIKEGAQLEETDEYQLPVAPTPDTDLKSGTITKVCMSVEQFILMLVLKMLVIEMRVYGGLETKLFHCNE